MPRQETRVYPRCCTSMYCGKGPDSCPSCTNYKTNQAFKRWVQQTGAGVEDPVWCPTVYTATITS